MKYILIFYLWTTHPPMIVQTFGTHEACIAAFNDLVKQVQQQPFPPKVVGGCYVER